MTERHGIDDGVLSAFILVPPLVAIAWVYLLTGGFDETLAAIVWALMALALRPVVWGWAAGRDGLPAARAESLRERQSHSVNTSFIATIVLGLAALDVVRLPGAPFWTDQPRASFALVAVVVYLVWLSRMADIPHEVSEGWAGLLGRERKGRNA